MDLAATPSQCHMEPSPSAASRKQTCAQCRTRKVRCDGNLDGCAHCARLGYDCSFRAPTSPAQPPAPLLQNKRPRVSHACENCSRAKVRCSGEVSGCRRCRLREISCVFPDHGVRRVSLSGQGHDGGHNQTSQSDEGSPGLHQTESPRTNAANTDHMHPASLPFPRESQQDFISHEQAVVALRRFFESLHCLPGLAFLHKPSLMRRFSKRKLEPPLLAAIVALSSRLPGATSEEKETGFQCADMAEGLVLRSSGQPTFVDTQALLLLLKFRHWTGASNMVFLSMAQLTRIAFALRLNYEKSNLSFFVQESRRRLMWGIYMLDVVLADGQEEFTTCPITTIHLRLPSMEDNFELDVENASERIETQDRSPTSLGIIAYYLRVTHLYDGIIRYLKKASSPKMATDAQWSDLQRLEKELNAFMAHLPSNERYSQKNLELRAYSPRLSRYVMTHVWWHHCYSILFRELALNPRDHGTIRIRDLIGEMGIEACRNKCLAHAQSIADIFSSLQDLGGDACILDMEMAHCALSSAEILMQNASTTIPQVTISRDESLHKVSTCLRLAKGLCPVFPAISEMVAELTSAVETFSLGQSTLPELVSTSCTAMRPYATKHSALYRTNFQDDSYSLEMADPPSEADGQTADRNHLDNAHCSSGSGPEGQATASHMATQAAGINESMTHAPYATDAQGNSPWAGSGSDIWDQMSLFQVGFNDLGLSTGGPALLDILPSGEGLHPAYNSWGREHMG